MTVIQLWIACPLSSNRLRGKWSRLELKFRTASPIWESLETEGTGPSYGPVGSLGTTHVLRDRRSQPAWWTMPVAASPATNMITTPATIVPVQRGRHRPSPSPRTSR
jgi:hypothetical protein